MPIGPEPEEISIPRRSARAGGGGVTPAVWTIANELRNAGLSAERIRDGVQQLEHAELDAETFATGNPDLGRSSTSSSTTTARACRRCITRYAGASKAKARFRRFVTDTTSWLAARNVDVEQVNFLITDPRRVEEVVLHLDSDGGHIGLPFALACDHDEEEERIIELRLYFSTCRLTGRHANRPALLQPDLDLNEPDVVGEYQRALATGDVDAILARVRAGRVHARARRRRLRPPGHR